MKEKISVVLPTWNRAYTIQNAIRSIIDQTFEEWFLYVIDDGSTDGTKRIVDSFAHPKIIYKKLEHTGNVSHVRNEGNKLAKGELIVVQDSDDTSLPDRLEEIWNKYEETNADLIYNGMYLKFHDPYHNCIARMIRPALPYSKEHILREQYIPGQVAYKREKILKFPYLEDVHCCDDYAMLLQFALEDCKFEPIYKNLYEYGDSPDSINVLGEKDGRRKRDVEVILKWLKEKYGIDAHATMKKSTLNGELLSSENL